MFSNFENIILNPNIDENLRLSLSELISNYEEVDENITAPQQENNYNFSINFENFTESNTKKNEKMYDPSQSFQIDDIDLRENSKGTEIKLKFFIILN